MPSKVPDRNCLTEKTRAFFALTFADEKKTAIAVLVKQLEKRQALHDVKWVLQEKLHLTLRFLGDISAEQVVLLTQESQKAIADKISPFDLSLTRLKVFPSVLNPHALVLLPEPQMALFSLAASLDRFVIEQGIRPLRHPFVPHVTLAHLPPAFDYAKIEPILLEQNLKLTTIDFHAATFTLFKSKIDNSQNLYQTLAEFHLA